MADMDYDDFGRSYDQGGARPRQVGRLVHLAGAACSVALLIGLGAWGYKLAVRDVTGIPCCGKQFFDLGNVTRHSSPARPPPKSPDQISSASGFP